MLREERHDLSIAHLVKIHIMNADGEERLRAAEADDLVDVGLEFSNGLWRSHGDGKYKAARTSSLKHLQGCANAGAGGNAVVHEDERPTAEGFARATYEIDFAASLDFCELLPGLRRQIVGGD